MHDSARMRLRQRAGNLCSIARHDFSGQWASLDFRCQSGAFDELHDQVVWADVVKRANVGMVQRGNRPSFELKSFAIAFGRNLDGNHAPQSRIDGAVDGSHTTGADLGFDLIRTELRSRGNDGSRRLGQEAFERLENLTAGFQFQHSFHAGADFGICTLQQGCALVGITLLRRVV
ncbi:MAG: hypothetical protein ABSE35_20190 [Bryobacteraceae bacterium]